MRKLATVAVPFALAVLLRVYLLPGFILLPLGLGAVCAVGFVLFLRRRKTEKGLRLCLIAAGLAAAFLWCALYDVVVSWPAQNLAGQTLKMTAEVTDWPCEGDYGISVEVRLLREHGVDFRAILYLDRGFAGLRPGDRVDAIVHLTDAGVTMGEQSDYYYALGIRLKAKSYGEVSVIPAEGTPIRYAPAYLARALKDSIANVLPEEAAAMAHAVVTGDRTGLTDSFYAALRRSGLAHAVAVSGMHLTFLVFMLNILLRRGRKAAVFSIAVIVLFTLMAGATPSVTRAAVMQIFLLLAPLFDRDYDAVTSLSAALLLLLLFNPYAVASVSLQLSFGAVVGILLVGGRINRWLCAKTGVKRLKKWSVRKVRNGALSLIFAWLSVSLGAMLTTVPLTVLHFRSFTLLSPVSNLLCLWAVELLFIFALLGGLVGLALPAVGGVVALPALLGSRFLSAVIPALARVPFASISLVSAYFALWLVFAYSLLALNLLWKRKEQCRPRLSALLCAAALFGVIGVNSAAFSAGDLTVSVLDVGQGQSVLLRAGDCYTLVDCGGTGLQDPGDVAADFLESIGRRKLDFLVLTHYHADHAGGIPALLRRIAVDTLLLPDVEEKDPLRQEILRTAREQDISVRFIRTDTQIQVNGGLTLTIYPPLGAGSTNELGLSVLATAGTFDALITGDMNTSVERLLLGHARLPDIELLVVGHHGSRYATSKELLTATRPELAVISVGYNSYGHPTDEVLNRLEAAGAEVYRTDRNGTVTVTAAGAA